MYLKIVNDSKLSAARRKRENYLLYISGSCCILLLFHLSPRLLVMFISTFISSWLLLTSSVLSPTPTFLHISEAQSEGGGLLSSGVVMQHVDKQWSFGSSLYSQPQPLLTSASAGTEEVELALTIREDSLPQKDTVLSLQRFIKVPRHIFPHVCVADRRDTLARVWGSFHSFR